MSPLNYLDTSSFWSIWYWIVTIVTWSMTSHWTMGVPYDLVVMAEKKGEKFAENCDTLTKINAERLIYYFDRGGLFMSAFVGFSLAALATLGVWLRIEIFMAIFVLAAPLMLVSAFSVRFAYKMEEFGWEGAVLRKKLKWRRFWNQVIGLIAISISAFFAVVFYLYIIGVF